MKTKLTDKFVNDSYMSHINSDELNQLSIAI